MKTFTLDTNCIIDVEEQRADAVFVLNLAEAHRRGEVHVSVIAMMASERQKPDGYLQSFDVFSERLKILGLSHLGLCLPLCYFDISFFDKCLLAGKEESELEMRIHEILFPDIEFKYADFCRSRNVDPNAADFDRKWRNAKCDVQALWSHVNEERNIFVTNDKNYLGAKRPSLLAISSSDILTPKDASSLLLRSIP